MPVTRLEHPPAPTRVSRYESRQQQPTVQRQLDRLYRVVWRWHFYSGLIVAPVLIVVAATGALYIFKDELEPLLYPQLLSVVPGESRVSYDRQVAAAQAAAGAEFRLSQLEVPADATRSVVVYGATGQEFRGLHVDPNSGQVLGELGKNHFFAVVLRIHRTLLAGTTGRIVVELMTCWTIVLLASGAYLWWPRKGWRIGGVLWPRFGRHRYVTLRDLHAVCGFFCLAVAPLIAGTGLLYTYVWGSGYNYAAVKSGAYDIFLHPPKSHSAASAPRQSLDELVAVAAREMPGSTLTVRVPQVADGAFVVFGSSPSGPSSDGIVVLDHATGNVLVRRANRDYSALGWWATWNYPLHVGSILGLTTKFLWLGVCLVLMLLPVTGVWMWWQRRPRGQFGFPRRPQAHIPRKLVAGILLLAVLLPALGLSLLVLLSGEWLVSLARSRRTARNIA